MSKRVVGKILDPDLNPTRDAIHIPVCPVYAPETLHPGQKIRVERINGKLTAFGVSKMSEAIGVVDPYLDKSVDKGQLFDCHLKPNSVAKLWHEWRHPKFDEM